MIPNGRKFLNWIENMDKFSLDRVTLRKFSLTMLAALGAIGTILLLRHRHNYIWFYFVGIAFFLTGLFATNLLKPIYAVWMKLAFILGWINARVLLLAIFYLIFTPMGLAMRLFGVDLLDRKIEKGRQSYWKRKEKHKLNPLDYERQF